METGNTKVPLSSTTIYLGSFCLIFISILWSIIRLDTVEVTDIFIGDIDTEDELISFHDTLRENKSNLLIVSAILYFTLPFVLIHVFSMKNIYESLFSDIDSIRALKFVYIFSWTIEAVIVSVLLSPSLIIATYYDWNFVDATSNAIYTGYYIQLFCIHYVLVLGDGVYFVSCITAIIPWIVLYIVCFKNDSSSISDQFKQILLPYKCGQNRLCQFFLIVFILIIIFCALSSIFDWNKSGFYSLYGFSQLLSAIILISYFIISLWMIHIAKNIDKLKRLKANYSNINDQSDTDAV